MALCRNFTSDNVTPACAPIMAAIQAANEERMPSYGADPLTLRLQAKASEVFGTEVAIFPVATGTAANALALAQLAPPYGAVYCYEAAHIVTDECAAPEFFSGGAKPIGLPAADGRIGPEQIEKAVAFADEMGVHHVKPAAVSLTQATECGTVYDPSQVAAISAVARRHRLGLHMDGARFANALAHLGCDAAHASWRCGVDVLSLGATKNGALCAEAVVFFNPAQSVDFARRRKQGGHLWSKMRYLSAQLLAYLSDDLWLVNARQANAMATALAKGLRDIRGVRLLQTVHANELFVAMPEALVAALERDQFLFYRWPFAGLQDGVAVRLVTSYATTEADVAAFAAAAHRYASSCS
ncbi:MAG: threonine aldolase family protein [Steroidobacterales bacterium]